MTGEQVVAAVSLGMGVRWWWKSNRVAYHTRQRDRHDAAAWRWMRRWW